MFSNIRARVSSAHLMAALALFIVLGGTAFAASLKKNSVGTKQLKKNAVTETKIKANAVTGSKIAVDAVTGAKVDEASLGKVPAATIADSATTAINATEAANATTLAGRGFQQVRGLADGVSDSSSQGLDDVLFEQVMTEDIGIPTGGASVIANASVELTNNTGAQQGGQCKLRIEGADMSSTYNVTIPAGATEVVSLTGFANEPLGTGVLNPRDIGVFCVGSGADNSVAFINGDLAVQRVPSGS